MAFLGGSGEELEIPEESSRDLQNVKVSDQYDRETTGDFLEADALRLMEQHSERKQTKSKSRAHRKAKRYHHRKKEVKNKETATINNDPGAKESIEGATDNKSDTDNEITKYLLGATNLAKPLYREYQTVLEDIDEVSSSKKSDAKNDSRRKSNDSVTAVMDLAAESSDVVESQEDQADKTRKESVQDWTLSFQEESEWEVLCEKLQNYTFNGNES